MELLGDVCGQFTEGFDLADFREASALLRRLEEGTEAGAPILPAE